MLTVHDPTHQYLSVSEMPSLSGVTMSKRLEVGSPIALKIRRSAQILCLGSFISTDNTCFCCYMYGAIEMLVLLLLLLLPLLGGGSVR